MAAALLTVVVALAVVPSGGSAQELTPTAAPTRIASGPVVEDDPVAAFIELSRVRNDCIRELSILCLDAALQQGSAAMDDDVELIRSIERGDGGRPLSDPSAVELAERMGDAALLNFRLDDEPAPVSSSSVLLVKTEAGWRIRSYVAG